jgi:glycosyltransferase involved in cell wall biosynthesis
MNETESSAPRACVVIPTYNEVGNITSLLEGIHSLDIAADLHALVVDDNSQDGTADHVVAAASRLGEIELMQRPAKLGLGTAYVAGFRRAFDLGTRHVLTMDADLSHSPQKIPELLAAMENQTADLAIGSRYIPGGATLAWGLHRKILSRTANWLAHTMLGLKARDCTSGFRCYRTSFLREIDLEGIRTDGYSVLMELLFLCEARGAKVVEIPIVFHNRKRGKSKISRAEIFKAVGTLMRLWRRHP